MVTRSVSEGYFVTPSLAYASGYDAFKSSAVELVRETPDTNDSQRDLSEEHWMCRFRVDGDL